MYDETASEMYEINRLLQQMREAIVAQATAVAELREELMRERSRINTLTYWAN